MSDPAKAVFLSYASQDAEAARAIAEALRAAGVEVWFDQNELVGGDAWDGKIRDQIGSCALFVPVISAATQARSEGYFRLEWKLAAQRMQMISDRTAFLLPVVIDGTSDAKADVPREFKGVQWTRLPDGQASEAFCARVVTLLGGDVAGVADPGGSSRASRQSPGSATPATPKSSGRPWLVPALLGLALVAGAAVLLFSSREPTPGPVAPAAVQAKAPPASASADRAPVASKSIAVLPFVNMSPDPDNAFFTDGVHEDVITGLAKIRDLKVISRTSVMGYRDAGSRNLRRIGSDLGVATILEGSVRRVGTRVRVTAQLIDATTDEHRWAETYDREITDVFAIQAEIAEKIATALQANLTPGERQLLAERPTTSTKAYDLALRARLTFENGAVRGIDALQSMERAISLYEQAVVEDPVYAAAYAQLTYLNGRMYWYGYLDPSPARKERARLARDQTLRLAAGKAQGHLAMGAYLYHCESDWRGALAEFEALQRQLPNDAQITYFVALCHRRLGDFDASATAFYRAMELNPNDAVNGSELVSILGSLRRFSEVVTVSDQYSAKFPEVANFKYNASDARLELGAPAPEHFVDIGKISSNTRDERWINFMIALYRGDLSAAEAAFADPALTVVSSVGGVLNDPADLERARVAYLLGKTDDARRFGLQAVDYYRKTPWTSRQVSIAQLGTALALAFAAEYGEAIPLARQARAQQIADDKWLASDANLMLASVYLVAGRSDDALTVLREMMLAPGKYSPAHIRLDPMWRSVRDDPRFEAYLKLARIQ